MDLLSNIISHYSNLWLQQSQQLLALYQDLFFSPDRSKTAAKWYQTMHQLSDKDYCDRFEKLLLDSLSRYSDTMMTSAELTQLQQACIAYASNFYSLSQEALKNFYPLLTTRLEQEPLPNWQELLGLWLDSYEKVYQQIIVTKQYQESYGELINACMRWHKANS